MLSVRWLVRFWWAAAFIRSAAQTPRATRERPTESSPPLTFLTPSTNNFHTLWAVFPLITQSATCLVPPQFA